MTRSRWKPIINQTEAFALAMEEMAREDAERRDDALQGKTPEDWEREHQEDHWVLVRFPIMYLSLNLGLMKNEKVRKYAAMPASTMPPILLDWGGQIMNGRHRALAAWLRGDKKILAYAPRRRSSIWGVPAPASVIEPVGHSVSAVVNQADKGRYANANANANDANGYANVVPLRKLPGITYKKSQSTRSAKRRFSIR